MRITHYSEGRIQQEKRMGLDLFQHIQDSFGFSFFYWIINSKYRKAVNLRVWIDDQYNDVSQTMKDVAAKIPDKLNLDTQALEVLKWVKKNITYVRDYQKWKFTEKWQTAEETLKLRTGDCEDGAILMYILCRLKGIPANRLYLCAGDVVSGNKTAGHCWLAYKPRNYPLNYVFLDWCYWYSSKAVKSRSLFHIQEKEILEYKHSIPGGYYAHKSNYHNIWFLFNEGRTFSRVRINRRSRRG